MCSTERSENRRRGRPDIYLQSPNGLSRQSLGKIIKVQGGILNYTVLRKRFTSWITSYILLMSQTERFFLMKQMLQKTEITHLKIRDDVNGDLNRKEYRLEKLSTNTTKWQIIQKLLVFQNRLVKFYLDFSLHMKWRWRPSVIDLNLNRRERGNSVFKILPAHKYGPRILCLRITFSTHYLYCYVFHTS